MNKTTYLPISKAFFKGAVPKPRLSWVLVGGLCCLSFSLLSTVATIASRPAMDPQMPPEELAKAMATPVSAPESAPPTPPVADASASVPAPVELKTAEQIAAEAPKPAVAESTVAVPPLTAPQPAETADAAPAAAPAAPAPAEAAAMPGAGDVEISISAQAVAAAEKVLPLSLPASVSLRVDAGDTLINMLTDTGVSYDEAQEVVTALRKIFDPRKLDIGQQVAVNLDPSNGDPSAPTIRSISLPVSRTAVVEVTRLKSGELRAKKIEAPLVKQLVKVSQSIRGSFYQTGLNAGVPANALADLIKVYSYDIDFQRDLKRGNRLEVMIERLQTEDGIIAGYGDVVYSSIDLGNRKVSIYRHTDKSGYTDYYNEKGESLKKALLRTPINGARITSGFGMRAHPILGYSKMHRGVDFGALAGTPIYAAGDGTVDKAGWNGSYGNYVRIKHDGKYSTAYAHASRIAKGIKPGVKVRQGQVVAYVGSTGRSTGPHLHYEILLGEKQVNPSGVRFKTGNSLSGKELAQFKSNVKKIQVALKEPAKQSKPQQVAQAATQATPTAAPKPQQPLIPAQPLPQKN